MKFYRVGGSVRDELLGQPVHEQDQITDWVVVGGRAEDLLKQGYRQVGKQFPVFLHPETREEYALARQEWKHGVGHTGFITRAHPDVTLDEDLARRDLTINAMARDAQERLIDPFGGQRDLARKRLRHVGPAFVEDPLRVFRVARFAATLPGFTVDPETVSLMASMADTLASLSAERVWRELVRALAGPAPHRFVEVLDASHCLNPWLAELADVRLPASPQAAIERYAALGWQLSPAALSALDKRLKAPRAYRELALDLARHGRLLAAWRAADPEALMACLTDLGSWRRPDRRRRVFNLVTVLAGVSLADLDAGLESMATTTSDWLAALREDSPALSGAEIGRRLRRHRTDFLARLQQGA